MCQQQLMTHLLIPNLRTRAGAARAEIPFLFGSGRQWPFVPNHEGYRGEARLNDAPDAGSGLRKSSDVNLTTLQETAGLSAERTPTLSTEGSSNGSQRPTGYASIEPTTPP
jgi:hypothetical protein